MPRHGLVVDEISIEEFESRYRLGGINSLTVATTLYAPNGVITGHTAHLFAHGYGESVCYRFRLVELVEGWRANTRLCSICWEKLSKTAKCLRGV